MHGFMPPLGWRIDHLIGFLSRGLHVRAAKDNTVSDLILVDKIGTDFTSAEYAQQVRAAAANAFAANVPC